MAELSAGYVVKEFESFGISLESGSPLVDKLLEIGHSFKLDPEGLLADWVAFSTRNGNVDMDGETLEQWEGHLETTSRSKTPRNRGRVAKTTGMTTSNGTAATYSQDNLSELFGDDLGGGGGGSIEMQDDLVEAYGTPEDRRNKKRSYETTPTNPLPAPKARHEQNGSTPTTPHISSQRYANASTPYRAMAENGMLSTTPGASFNQRSNSGQVMCTLNDSLVPEKWVGSRAELQIQHYNPSSALTASYEYMFQKVSEKSLVLLERIRDFGDAICQQHGLSSPLCVSQPSLEPAVFTGKVACEGEGHLNARSCLLEGLSHSRNQKGACVRLEIPQSISCSLFPGQIIAVEGVNNYNGLITPTKIYDEGVFPPLPQRTGSTVPGFTMLCAAGPFSTTDSLSLDPLHSLLDVVEREKPNILLLLGPFLDSTHPQVKNCDIPGDLSFDDFFETKILSPIYKRARSCRTRVILVPSQHDVHHPWMVYPQPPFHQPPKGPKHNKWPSDLFCAPDPSTLSVSGLCVGVTSTDVLFHLSARSMSRGTVSDRMARVARHVLQQQCYYPLLPAFSREEASLKPKPSQTPGLETTPTTTLQAPSEEKTEVNLDLIHMFDEYEYACLPVRPDLLFLPSNLKPFTKVLDGCICVNPGHLTKRTSGGTFAKVMVSDQLNFRQDLSSDIAVQIVHI